MVLMTGDAPMGFIATYSAAANSGACGSTAGWCSRSDGTLITKQHDGRVQAQLAGGGDLYLIADATDMGRARDALGRL